MQLNLFSGEPKPPATKRNSTANKITSSDLAFHDWYRFVLSFPPHLVRDYLARFNLPSGATVLDPFCGTGTTLIEARLSNLTGIGIEANTMAYFASQVKADWAIEPDELIASSLYIADQAHATIKQETTNLRQLPQEAFALLLKDSISPLPLHKAMILLEAIDTTTDSPCHRHQRLAFAKALVFSISNLRFGPEVGVSRKKKTDFPVVESWLAEIRKMAEDLRQVDFTETNITVHHADARQLSSLLHPHSIDAIFTSPPYPNEKDYTRTTRLESVMLGMIQNKTELRELKYSLLRSNTRNVYKHDSDDEWVSQFPKIQALAERIEKRRLELGKTSGFERLYGRVTKLYFGGMARHLAELRPFLKPGAYLGYVVGDQASYLQVMIHTGQLLADIAQALGYQVESIDLFRTRQVTATRQQIREEVLVLRWMGSPEGT